MKIAPKRYSYSDLIELSLYSDLKSYLRPNNRIMMNSSEEYERIVDLLTENSVNFIAKSKREIIVEPL